METPLETLGFDTAIDWRGPNRMDLIILIALVVVWPIYSFINIKLNPPEKIRHEPNLRLESYNTTILQLWAFTAAIIGVWTWTDRPFETLGFQHTLDTPTKVTWAAAAIMIAFSAAHLVQVFVSRKALEKFAGEFRDVGEHTQLMMPRTGKEYRRSMLVAVTAGVTEEIIFRGYLIWALSLFVHPWAAGALSVLAFVLLHIYQERAGLIQVAIFAVIATVMYLVSGSLWPVIVMHIGVDVLNLSLGWKVGKEIRQ